MKLTILSLFLLSSYAQAKCFVVDGSNKKDFDGQGLSGYQIEKKSMSILDKEFPNLKAKEKMFSGEVVVCADCSAKHIKCE